MSSYFLHVLTPKGLRYLIDHFRHHPDLLHAIRNELRRRKDNAGETVEPEKAKRVVKRDLDGYERDQ